MTTQLPLLTRLFLLTTGVLALTGCFEFKERVTLNKKNAGVYALSIGMDLAPVVDMLSLGGDRDATLGNVLDGTKDLQEVVAEPEQLAPGLTWLGGNAGLEGEMLVMGMEVGFYSLDALRQPLSADATAPVLRVPVTSKGKTLTFEGPLYAGLADAMDSSSEEMQMIKMAAGSMTFVFEIDAPNHKVKKHDADSHEGTVLRWSHTLDEFQAGAPITATLKAGKPAK